MAEQVTPQNLLRSKQRKGNGFSGIHYDLSRYVLIDHIEGDFNCYNQSNKKELDSFLLKVKENLTECVNLNFGQFI